uniref:Uncharacterized protein n=1 Tax=Tetraselmis sp. GSL018 TaxID=582737 RepID=A0A061QRH3_9CHLO
MESDTAFTSLLGRSMPSRASSGEWENYRSSLVSNQMNHRVDDQTAATSPSTPSTITASPNQTPFLPNSYHPRHNTRPHAVHPAEIVQIPRSAARLAPIGSSHHAKSNSEETFSSEMLSSPQQEKFAAPVHPLGASLNFS